MPVNANIPDEVWSEIAIIVHRLASAQFDALGTRAGRCRPADLERVIRDYGRTLVALPETALKLAQVYPVVDGSLAVDIPLWTQEEGRSDLELRVEAVRANGRWTVRVSDLRVP